jgi:hypothetical protein
MALIFGQRACPCTVRTRHGVCQPPVPTFFKETAMQDDRSNDERQRDYEQIKQDLMRRGRGVAEAEAIAARTVSRQRAETQSANDRPDRPDRPASAAESARSSEEERTPSERSYRELYAEARSRGITGRSTMSKAELERRLVG